MEELMKNLGYVSPSVLIGAVVLCCCIAFYVCYWYSMRPRRESLEWIMLAEHRPRRLSFTGRRWRMEKRDVLPLLVITVVYGCTAFFRLGDTTAVQSFARFEADTVVEFAFKEPQQVSRLMFYTGICESGYRDSGYTLEYSEDAEHWQSMVLEQNYNQLLKWQVQEETVEDGNGGETTRAVTFAAKYFRITATPRQDRTHPERDYMDLGELAFYDETGTMIPVEEVDPAGEALFDEQDLVVDYPFWTNSTYFDEIYHPRTAQENRLNIYPYEVSHPPLGKLIIALGIEIFGLTPFGWRFMGTLFGILMLPILYAFIKNMFGKTAAAICGSVLFAVDFMHLTQTRIATIDTYGVFFILCMYWFMYRWLTLPADIPLRKSLPSLFLCGVSWAIGVACKWTVIYGGVGLAILWVIGMVLKYREWTPGESPRYAPFFWGTAGLSVVFFIVLPLCVYVASYYPYARADGDTSWQHLLHIVWDNQIYMFTYHEGVHTPHPYSSRWYQWIFDARPILYFRDTKYVPGSKALFCAFDNPVVSWAGLLCVVGTGIETFRRKSARALFITLGYLSQLVPWMFIFRITFAYHYFPSMLFLVFGIAYAMDGILERDKEGSTVAVYGLTGLAVVLYAAFYPVLIGLYVPNWYARLLQWLPSWPI